jgi:UDP-N-acetylmuramoyl-L-alanyl-D-glutamate--2,6-diaminopimelate ligase
MANALGVLGCLMAYGIPFQEAVKRLGELPPVPGRMQQIGERPLAVIDYAHTPDALEKVMQALRPLAAQRGGKLIAVFGAGGNRDAAKRPLMGEVAARLADRVVLTSDNPRFEDPQAIIDAVRAGVTSGAGAVTVDVDRRRAIEQALAQARAGDVVVIAGKGHETTQTIGDMVVPFDDREVARAALAARAQGTGGGGP